MSCDVSSTITVFAFLKAIGGISYTSFYQRILSTSTDTQAKITCYAGAVLCPILAIPSLVIGAVAASTST